MHPFEVRPKVEEDSLDIKYPTNRPELTIGVVCDGTPSSSQPKDPSPGIRILSAVIFTCSDPYAKLFSLSGVKNEVPAYAASSPNTRSSSIGWPHDSCTWRANCEPPIITSVTVSMGQGSAVINAAASVAVFSELPGMSSEVIYSHPAHPC